MADIPVVKLDLGNLTEPAKVLVEKISDLMGGVFKPYQMVRVAKAQAEVDRIEAEAEIVVTDLHRRAARRWLEEEAKKQANIESITGKALPLLEESAAPQDVSDDWITKFFEQSRIVSDEEMQQLWARVLAGEANAPGSFARKTVNIIADLDKADAQLFTELCGFVWFIDKLIVPLVLNLRDKRYRDRGITFGALEHLQSLGLVRLPASSDYVVRLPEVTVFRYYQRSFERRFRSVPIPGFGVGKALFTRAGRQLAFVCHAQPVDGFFDYIFEKWGNRDE